MSSRVDDSQRKLLTDDDIRGLSPPKRMSKMKTGNSAKTGQDPYLVKFRKEVDFHHKIAYRFEKAYRLNKEKDERKQKLNLDIIECIGEHSDYLEQDPMSLFYCLYFCIYYNNPDLVEFLRMLIHKLRPIERNDRLLEFIDIHGIERLRRKLEPIN